MAGHSKWANIQHRKNAQDAKRGKLFTKLIREITVSARMGGDVLSSNPRLRAAVDTALTANMTRDTIDRGRVWAREYPSRRRTTGWQGTCERTLAHRYR